MDKFEAEWVTASEFLPEPPNSEFPLLDVGIMKQHDCRRRELGKPTLKVILDCVVGMEAINMQKVD